MGGCIVKLRGWQWLEVVVAAAAEEKKKKEKKNKNKRVTESVPKLLGVMWWC